MKISKNRQESTTRAVKNQQESVKIRSRISKNRFLQQKSIFADQNNAYECHYAVSLVGPSRVSSAHVSVARDATRHFRPIRDRHGASVDPSSR